jgi:formylglycine-generating enzyme required for sulfatase activity
VLPSYSSTPEKGPAIVGTYAENDWGLYDMHGNAFELCLDWFENDITKLNGAVNIDPANPLNTLGGTAGATRVRRGGSYHAARSDCRSGFRLDADPASDAGEMWGFRLTCRAGLK